MSGDPQKPDATYGLAETAASTPVAAPELPYRPRDPRAYRPGIAVVGCGGIAVQHLRAYRAAGYRVVVLCRRQIEKARPLQQEHFPEAELVDDWREVLGRDDVEVVDLAAHPEQRAPMIEAMLEAGKHVLSQKPYVLDLDFGERMADLADGRDVKLAVNLNGRWAPHHAWIREALRAGLVGAPFAAHLAVHWNHNWIAGTAFDALHPLVLYDFGIHWFDLVAALFEGRRALRVHATMARSPGQEAQPPLLGQALVEFEDAQASVVFDGDTRFGPEDATFVAGPRGTLTSRGPSLESQRVTLHTEAGHATPELEGSWFTSGFHGTMAELLCAIEEGREPRNGARAALPGLALCFAAVAAAARGEPVEPGSVRDVTPYLGACD